MNDAHHYQQLDKLGYVLLTGVMDTVLLDRLRGQIELLYHREGESAGSEFRQEPGSRRLANLLNKGQVFQDIIAAPAVLPLVAHVLGGSVKLSSINARSVNPNSDQTQPLHCDMGAMPDEHGASVCNTVWMLDDFTPSNGALRVVPGSHHCNRLPQSTLDDPFADHAQQTLITGRAGSVIVINAHLWHGGMANHTAYPRRAVHAFYCRRDKPQQQYQKRLLDNDLQASLPSNIRQLLALDDVLNDELSTQQIVRSGFLK